MPIDSSTAAPRTLPRILAPAGNRDAFLAAVAAGADAIYCGLKSFSARMEAKNFSVEELAGLIGLARDRKVAVYVTLNSLIKPGEVDEMTRTVAALTRAAMPDALIVQDLSLFEVLRNTGFTGEIHLSTLANVSFPMGIAAAASLPGVRRIVLPRELSIDEIKAMARACPGPVDLEVFIHGALCYGVSGRCYWSSYFGGMSGLRGRCVQPCRRVYQQEGERDRHFSCQDLSLDTLVKVLKEIPKVTTWKIEGRKKSPHYVYYTVTAYRMLRDEFGDPAAKKAAMALLEMALGRKGTHYRFLSQRQRNPLERGRDTGSGFQLGVVKGGAARFFLSPRIDLLTGDAIRIGYEDQPWHKVMRIRKTVPRNGQFFLNLETEAAPPKGTPVFLTDRREPALAELIASLAERIPSVTVPVDPGRPRAAARPTGKALKRPQPVASCRVFRHLPPKPPVAGSAMWLSAENLKRVTPGSAGHLWAWLPPVIWPDGQAAALAQLGEARSRGIRQFVLNAPWQTEFFRGMTELTLWAGPFCNTANPEAVSVLKTLGFAGAVVSPELGREDVLAMPHASPLPLGIVVGGHFPLCISRIAPETLQPEAPFTSPKGEAAWLQRSDDNFWVFPNWAIDLAAETEALKLAGYRMLVTLNEPVPGSVFMKARAGLWNWSHDLK